MDALASAYASHSDDDDDRGCSLPVAPAQQRASEHRNRIQEWRAVALDASRKPVPIASREACVPAIGIPTGRYVSKRERAEAEAEAEALALAATRFPVSVEPLPAVGGLTNFDVPMHILKRVKRFEKEGVQRSRLPRELTVRLQAHTKAVNAIRWSPSHGFLLASAGMDQKAHIWNVWGETKHKNVRTLSSHTAAIKDIQWSLDGCHVLTCGFDEASRLTDAETGSEKNVFREDQYVNVVKFHPVEREIFLSGGSKGFVRLWDVRTGKIVCEYSRGLGQVMDMDFNPEGKQFVVTSDIAKRNASDKTIVVWDFKSQIPLSNQVYLESYTCPCVRYHPYDIAFVAQSNANYIAIFCGRPPFKMNKYKRFEGHQVSGFRVECNFSPDGELLTSGSADGKIFFYHYKSTKLLKVLEAHGHICTGVSYNPIMPSTVASCGWEGAILVFE